MNLVHRYAVYAALVTVFALCLSSASVIRPWIVIMKRYDGNEDFNRNWTEYRNGFGDKEVAEFWLGNEEIHRLTSASDCTLRVKVKQKSSGKWVYAEYSTFSLDSEDNKYTLRLSGYSGNAGDSLTNTSLPTNWYHGGMKFSTWDNDNDEWSDGNCAQNYKAGWWYNGCRYSCLTCDEGKDVYNWSSEYGWPTSGVLRMAAMIIKCK